MERKAAPRRACASSSSAVVASATATFDSSLRSEQINLFDPFVSCPICQSPISLSSLFVDRAMKKVLSEVERFERERLLVLQQQTSENNNNNKRTRCDEVKIDLKNFPKSIHVTPIFEDILLLDDEEEDYYIEGESMMSSMSRRRKRE